MIGTEATTAPCPHCKGTGTVTIPPEILTVEAYFFGCWQQAGHYWRHPRNPCMPDSDIVKRVGLARIDGGFCPGSVAGKPFDRSRPEVECEARLTHIEGWTILGWWDRSVDRRGACNSNIVVRGTYDYAAMLAVLHAQFPTVEARQKRALQLVQEDT